MKKEKGWKNYWGLLKKIKIQNEKSEKKLKIEKIKYEKKLGEWKKNENFEFGLYTWMWLLILWSLNSA